MDKYELQRLRDLPIEGVAERLGLSVNTHHKCLCPFHDDHHASMSFHRGRNTYRCFVCGAHGGTIDLVMRQRHIGFKEACRWIGSPSLTLPLGRETNTHNPPPLGEGREGGMKGFDFYAPFFEHPWLSDDAKRFLYGERRLDERVIRWCRLSSWRDKNGTPWLQIPYYDREGKLIGIQNRNLQPPPQGEGWGGAPRFRFPQGSQCSIYNLPVLNLLREGEELWITEGCSDCWAMLSAGRKAIAIPSATLLMPKDKQLLSTLSTQLSTQFHMFPDRDAPGERLFLQLKEVLPNLVHHHLPPTCKDFADYYATFIATARVKNI